MVKYDLRGIVDIDFPSISITERSRQDIVEYARTHRVEGVRVATGRFRTDREYNEFIENVLSMEIPS